MNMFTGIVESIGNVISASLTDDILKMEISCPHDWDLKLGDSISISGICSTVVNVEDGKFACEYMRETVRKTVVGKWQVGNHVNLERPMLAGSRIHGHFVHGHIDGTGRVQAIIEQGGSKIFKISAPDDILHCIVQRGSVAIDGISLTIADKLDDIFIVAIIPHTLSHSTIQYLHVGDEVNIETDMFVRHAILR